jgi:hypothetical protein
MKNIHKFSLLVTLLLILGTTGCKDFLKEKSISNITADSYYSTADGFESLVTSCYTMLRDITQQRALALHGTDIFMSGTGWDRGSTGDGLDAYDVNLNAENGDIYALWYILYVEIGRCNTVVSRAAKVAGISGAQLKVREGEARFLRAYCYFLLVQQWGDVPMPLTETTSASTKVVQTPAPKIYAQILSDLKYADHVLPVKASDYGRATKGAAQFLMARVYLTLGWNFTDTKGESIGGVPADFDSARIYADSVIAAYPLAQNYADIFPKHSQNPLTETFPAQDDENPEIIFAVQYNGNPATDGNDPADPYGDPEYGNDAHSVFGGDVEDIPGNIGRTPSYNRFQPKNVLSPAAYRLFDPNLDSRYSFDFVSAQYALKAVPGFHAVKNNNSVTIDISKGDTVIYFRPWDNPATTAEKGIDVGGTKHYAVYNVTDIGLNKITPTPFNSPEITPLMFKFWEPGIPYGDAYGTLDQPLFRVSEAYLIAAEAIVKGASSGKLGGADVYYNAVLDRALGSNAGKAPYQAADPGDLASLDSVSYRATAGNLTIDMILDERARELIGENVRWYDLKRTGTLISRAKAMNPWTRMAGKIDAHHLLRPIPEAEVELSSTKVSQNPGY